MWVFMRPELYIRTHMGIRHAKIRALLWIDVWKQRVEAIFNIVILAGMPDDIVYVTSGFLALAKRQVCSPVASFSTRCTTDDCEGSSGLIYHILNLVNLTIR